MCITIFRSSCVDEKDKTVSMGFGMMLMSLFAFIPSPIIFGSILDRSCLVWRKQCSAKESSTGNCWLYDGESLRHISFVLLEKIIFEFFGSFFSSFRWTLNTVAAVFLAFGTLFDVGVWYFVKNLKVYDDEGGDDEPRQLNVAGKVVAKQRKL